MIRLNTKKIKNLTALYLSGALLLLLAIPLFANENEEDCLLDKSEQREEQGYCINFQDVPVIEFVRFVSRISQENFIFDSRDLDFNISLSTGKSVSSPKVVQALIQLLKMHGLSVSYDAGYFVIHKGGEGSFLDFSGKSAKGLLASNQVLGLPSDNYEFFVYKLQYHEGIHIVETLKKIGAICAVSPMLLSN